MRLQTRKDCEAEARARRLLRQDLTQVNAEKAGMALELTTARQWIDRWRGRALAAEKAMRDTADAMRAAHRKLADENVRLRDELAAEREGKRD